MSFSVDCDYCAPPGNTLVAFQPHPDQKQSEFDAAWKAAASLVGNIECANCGARYQLADDPAGSVQPMNMSRPKITSINATSGYRAGGNVIFISGEALEVGDLVVRFAGKAAPTVDQRTKTTARVVVPQGCYRLNVEELLSRLVVAVTNGSFQVGESITTSDGSTGVVRHIASSVFMVYMSTLVTSLDDLVGLTVSGGSSGATGTINAVSMPLFSDGEIGRGTTSLTSGLMRDSAATPYAPVVDNPTDSFAPGELVEGTVSGAMVKLSGSPAYSGLVDITVENEYGQRDSGNTLEDAYTYQ